MAETPTMLAMSSASNTYGASDLMTGASGEGGHAGIGAAGILQHHPDRRLVTGFAIQPHRIGVPMVAAQRRIVQVFIADSHEAIPLDDCVLFKGEQKLTDATDQELFFELDIRSILEKHNEKRVKIVDKKVKDRTEYLEPAKVRDLKMVVVTVATL